jgi:hypothetical protein
MIAQWYRTSIGAGRSSTALAATRAATDDAADPPIPEPSGMPFSIRTSNPWVSPSRPRSASSARPAVFFSASSGNPGTTPSMPAMRTSWASIRCTVTRSTGPTMA